MDKLKFKSFTCPQNPTVYEEKLVRTPVYSSYTDGTPFFAGLSAIKRTITGSGVFWGEDAFAQYQELEALFDRSSPGNLVHPIWGTRYCYFTGLELTQEPAENYVAYKFTFTGSLDTNEIPQ